ncbi:uncharacterized protein LOC131882285 [Tigriopus californicus]|nr:uncharacterized protein LOC131882285 [Tigriopus californicus]XP_059085369.1 uncharacterized protein LOC131882285 [Tigriopus californicus]
MPWLNVELTDESLKMQIRQHEKESYINVIEKVHGNVLEDIVDALEGEFVDSEIRDIIHFLMPTQMKNLSFLDTLVQERRVIWPKEKSKFFTYPCLTLCCCKYDHKRGVIVYASIMTLLCVSFIVALAVFQSEIPKLEDHFSFTLPNHFNGLIFVVLGLNAVLHGTLIVGAWRHSCLWIAPWLTIFGAETLLLLGMSVRYSLASFLDADYELLVVASIGLVLWGFTCYFWFVVAALSIRYYNFMFSDEYYGIPKPSPGSSATQPSNTIEMTPR